MIYNEDFCAIKLDLLGPVDLVISDIEPVPKHLPLINCLYRVGPGEDTLEKGCVRAVFKDVGFSRVESDLERFKESKSLCTWHGPCGFSVQRKNAYDTELQAVAATLFKREL